ncbi:hypothetical protein ABW21_db0208013 [Orbilia brochopaga]|nr:hypothetical protein ABW21_db0208013 [Drechslerella brochopaga]
MSWFSKTNETSDNNIRLRHQYAHQNRGQRCYAQEGLSRDYTNDHAALKSRSGPVKRDVHYAHSLNVRWIRHHGYTPAQLFLGFDARLCGADLTPAEIARAAGLEDQVAVDVDAAVDYAPNQVNYYPLTKPETIALRFDALITRQQTALWNIRRSQDLTKARLASMFRVRVDDEVVDGSILLAEPPGRRIEVRRGL